MISSNHRSSNKCNIVQIKLFCSWNSVLWIKVWFLILRCRWNNTNTEYPSKRFMDFQKWIQPDEKPKKVKQNKIKTPSKRGNVCTYWKCVIYNFQSKVHHLFIFCFCSLGFVYIFVITGSISLLVNHFSLWYRCIINPVVCASALHT